ncbi:MAG: GNAT family N-acetyltransferase [Rubrobacteraceae bacterium]
MTLRPAEPEDETFLFRVYASTRSEELALLPWTEEQKETFLEMQFDAQSRYYRDHYPDASFDVVLKGAEPVGCLCVARWPEEMKIADIALLPEHRGRGVGTALLRELISEADASRKPVTIHVERFNPALRLYERLGFREKKDKGVYLLMEHSPGGG